MRIFCLVSALALSGCVHVKTEPIHVEPIQITVDVYVKMDEDRKKIDEALGARDETTPERGARGMTIQDDRGG